MGGEAGAAIFFKNLENLFAIAEGVEQRRDRANVERVRTQPQLMAGHAVQFCQNHADILGAGRSFHVQKFFDGFAVSQAVGDRSHVIHAVDVRIEHRIGTGFGDFFDATVQIADHALQAHDLLTVQAEDDAEYAMGRGMLRAHVDNEFIGIKKRLVGRVEIQRRECVRVRHYLNLRSGVRDRWHYWPLSIPRLICTHSLSCCRMP